MVWPKSICSLYVIWATFILVHEATCRRYSLKQICAQRCLRGQGGVLCHCNAMHFTGKRSDLGDNDVSSKIRGEMVVGGGENKQQSDRGGYIDQTGNTGPAGSRLSHKHVTSEDIKEFLLKYYSFAKQQQKKRDQAKHQNQNQQYNNLWSPNSLPSLFRSPSSMSSSLSSSASSPSLSLSSKNKGTLLEMLSRFRPERQTVLMDGGLENGENTRNNFIENKVVPSLDNSPSSIRHYRGKGRGALERELKNSMPVSISAFSWTNKYPYSINELPFFSGRSDSGNGGSDGSRSDLERDTNTIPMSNENDKYRDYNLFNSINISGKTQMNADDNDNDHDSPMIERFGEEVIGGGGGDDDNVVENDSVNDDNGDDSNIESIESSKNEVLNQVDFSRRPSSKSDNIDVIMDDMINRLSLLRGTGKAHRRHQRHAIWTFDYPKNSDDNDDNDSESKNDVLIGGENRNDDGRLSVKIIDSITTTTLPQHIQQQQQQQQQQQ